MQWSCWLSKMNSYSWTTRNFRLDKVLFFCKQSRDPSFIAPYTACVIWVLQVVNCSPAGASVPGRKWPFLSVQPLWESISVNIPLSWQLMLPRTEQLLTLAQGAFLSQWSLSWTVSPLFPCCTYATAIALSQYPNPPWSPPSTHRPHFQPFHLSQEGNTVISLLG